MLIHIITDKGHGYEPAVRASDKMHGVAKYDPATGKQSKPKAQARPRLSRLPLPRHQQPAEACGECAWEAQPPCVHTLHW